MNEHDHPEGPTLSTPATLSDSFDPARIDGNLAKRVLSDDCRVDRVDRVALRKGSLLAGLFGVDGALTPARVSDSVPTPTEPARDDPPEEPPTELPTEPPPVGSVACQFCESTRLDDCENPPGIRCDDCGRLTWIDDGETLCKVGGHDDDLAEMAPEDVATCDDCGRLCDTQTNDDAWHCSRCLPDAAAERRKRTRNFLPPSADVQRYTDARNG